MPPTSFDAARAGGEVAAMTAGRDRWHTTSVVHDDARSPHTLLTQHDATRREEHDVAHARAAELPAPAALRLAGPEPGVHQPPGVVDARPLELTQTGAGKPDSASAACDRAGGDRTAVGEGDDTAATALPGHGPPGQLHLLGSQGAGLHGRTLGQLRL